MRRRGKGARSASRRCGHDHISAVGKSKADIGSSPIKSAISSAVNCGRDKISRQKATPLHNGIADTLVSIFACSSLRKLQREFHAEAMEAPLQGDRTPRKCRQAMTALRKLRSRPASMIMSSDSSNVTNVRYRSVSRFLRARALRAAAPWSDPGNGMPDSLMTGSAILGHRALHKQHRERDQRSETMLFMTPQTTFGPKTPARAVSL